jgi:aminoglycoside phosphotransferase (APT) family kinase protein
MVQSRQTAPKTPSATLAAAIAARLVGRAPISVVRFTTGVRHYVFDVAFEDRPPIVVRLGEPSARSELTGGISLSGLLRPLGAPLPAILGDDLGAEFPWMAMERLAGQDLGAVIAGLSNLQLDRVAAEVSRAQAIVAQTRSAGRYGYASQPQRAPHGAWSLVLEDNLARSRARIAAAGLFDVALVDLMGGKLAALRNEFDRIAATPFLHDTTTKNVIVTAAGEFSGIVDVDDLCFGDPRYPAALTSAVLTAYFEGRDDYVRAWMRHAGMRDDRLFQFYVALFLLDLMGEHGHVFNGNDSPSTPAVRASLLQAFHERLAAIG